MKTLSNEDKFKDFAIVVKYVKPTENKGSRVSLKSEHFNKKIIFGFDYSCDTILEQAGNILIENKINVKSYFESKNSYTISVDWSEGKELFKIDLTK
tara:strand:- start:10762 stop:11052 length:291 start_codon:yes stop_codon:yes gene_type:complete